MRKVIAGILMVASLGAHAAPMAKHVLSNGQAVHALSLVVAHDNQSISGKKYVEDMRACSDSGNLVCSSLLAAYYYDHQDFREAYPLLIKSQGIIKSNGSDLAPSESMLGDTFRFGHGVMQSDDKAIEHYRVCASTGDSDCALGMLSSYVRKAASAKAGSTSHRSAIKNIYVWEKVAQGLGMESYLNRAGGTENLSENIATSRKQMAAFFGEDLVSEGDGLASQICSTIDACIQ